MRRHCLLALGLISLCLSPVALCFCIGAANQLQKSDRYLELLHTKNPEDVTLRELYELSDCVVRGTVGDVEVRSSGFDEDPDREPQEMTFVRILPDKEGGRRKVTDCERDIIVRIPGGVEELDEDNQPIGGLPRLEPDQRIFLFLRRIRGTRYFYPVFGARGQFNIVEGKHIQMEDRTVREYLVRNEYLDQKYGKNYWSCNYWDFSKQISKLWNERYSVWDKVFPKKPAEITVADLLDVSECVVMGEVLEREVKKIEMEDRPECGPTPIPLVTIRVEEWLKVAPDGLREGEEQQIVVISNELKVIFENRVIYASIIGGETRFEPGQRVILFLVRREGTRYFYVALNGCGQYNIEGDSVYCESFPKTHRFALSSFIQEIRNHVRSKSMEGIKP